MNAIQTMELCFPDDIKPIKVHGILYSLLKSEISDRCGQLRDSRKEIDDAGNVLKALGISVLKYLISNPDYNLHIHRRISRKGYVCSSLAIHAIDSKNCNRLKLR